MMVHNVVLILLGPSNIIHIRTKIFAYCPNSVMHTTQNTYSDLQAVVRETKLKQSKIRTTPCRDAATATNKNGNHSLEIISKQNLTSCCLYCNHRQSNEAGKGRS